jgi:prophage tail gpP-like protein
MPTAIAPAPNDVTIQVSTTRFQGWQSVSITRNLVDCSAGLVNDPTIHGVSTLGVAQSLCKAYGITMRSAVADLGVAIPSFQIPLGETPYQIIESATPLRRLPGL